MPVSSSSSITRPYSRFQSLFNRALFQRGAWLWLSALVILILVFPHVMYWLNRLELLSFEDRQRKVLENRHHTGIVLIEIDRASLNNQMLRRAFGRYPWRRDLYGHLIEYLKPVQPKVLMMELSFTGGEDLEHPESDDYLYQAITPDFPLITALTEVALKDVKGVESPEARNLMFAKFRQEYLDFPQESLYAARFYEALQLPMAGFLKRSEGIHPIDSLVEDDNGHVRQVYLLGRGHLDKPYANFAMAGAEKALKAELKWLGQKQMGLLLPSGEMKAVDLQGEDAPIIRWQGEMDGPAQGASSPVYPRYRISDVILTRLLDVCTATDNRYEADSKRVCQRLDFEAIKQSGFQPVPAEVFRNKLILLGYHSDWFDANQHATLYTGSNNNAKKEEFTALKNGANGAISRSVSKRLLQYPNLFIQANILDNILSNQFVKRAPWRVPFPLVPEGSISLFTVMTTLLLALVVSGVTLRLKQVLFGIFSAFFCLLGYSAFTMWAYTALNLWVNWVVPTLGILISLFFALLFRMNRAERQRRQLRMTFGRYLSPANMTYIEKNPDKIHLGSQKKELTFLFCDIRGFSRLAEHYPAEVVQRVLDGYYSQMNDIILNRYGGVIGKMMGDGLLAYWGFPLESPDDPVLAVSAALEMQLKMTEWNQAQKKLDPTMPLIEIGIGINTGEALIGNVGSVDFMDFTVIGDSVNVASRLEKLNKLYGTGIIISEKTREKIQHQIQTRKIATTLLSGRTEPLDIFEPVGVYISPILKEPHLKNSPV
jgi:class 3 adenylate cyclase/CHASE2 domain-containing sensor protein